MSRFFVAQQERRESDFWLAHLEAGDEKKAGALFAKIAENEDVPETIRGRARQMASVLGVDAVGDVDELVKNLRGSAANARAVAPPAQ